MNISHQTNSAPDTWFEAVTAPCKTSLDESDSSNIASSPGELPFVIQAIREALSLPASERLTTLTDMVTQDERHGGFSVTQVLLHSMTSEILSSGVSVADLQDLLWVGRNHMFVTDATRRAFLSPQHQAKHDGIRELIAEAKKNESVDPHSPNTWPVELHSAYTELNNEASRAIAQSLLSQYALLQKVDLVGHGNDNLIGAMVAAGLPVLPFIQNLPLSRSDIRRIFKGTEDDDESPFVDPSIEEIRWLSEQGFSGEVGRELSRELSSRWYARPNEEWVFHHLEEIESVLEPRAFDQMVRTIMVERPSAWTARLDWLDSHPDLADFMLRSLPLDVENLEDNYTAMYAPMVEHAASHPDTVLQPEVLTEVVRSIVLENPVLLASPTLVGCLFSQDEYSSLLEHHLSSPPDTSLVKALCSTNDDDVVDLIKRHQDSVSTAARECLVEIFEQCYSIKYCVAMGIVSVDDVLGTLLQNPSAVHWSSVEELDEKLLWCAKDERFGILFGDICSQVDEGDLKEIFGALESRLYGQYEPDPSLRIRELMVNSVESAIHRIPSLAFNKDALHLVQDRASDLVERYVDSVSDMQPHLVYDVLDYIPPERLNGIVETHWRQLGTHLSQGAQVLPHPIQLDPDLQDKLKSLDPLKSARHLLDQGNSRSRTDIYQVITEDLRSCSYFPLYQKTLEDVAKKAKQDGVGVADAWELDSLFVQAARNLCILESSLPAAQFREEVFALGRTAQEEAVSAFIGGVRLNIDHDLVNKDLSGVTSELENRATKVLKTCLDLNPAQDLTLDSSTVVSALVYWQNKARLTESMATPMRECLLHHQDFPGWKMKDGVLDSDKAQTQLAAKGLIPQKLSAPAFQEWVQDGVVPASIQLGVDSGSVRAIVRSWMQGVVREEYIDVSEVETSIEDALDSYQEAVAPLRMLESERKRIKANLAGLSKAEKAKHLDPYRAVQAAIAEVDQDAIAFARGRLDFARLAAGEFEFVPNSRSLRFDSRVDAIPTVFKRVSTAFPDNSELQRELLSLQRTLLALSTADFAGSLGEGAHITDVVEFADLLATGVRPVVTCQHFDSPNEQNLGLLSTVVDPSVRVVRVVDAEGAPAARAILRLASESDGSRGLIIETVYSQYNHPKFAEALVGFALDKAEKMGIPLFADPQAVLPVGCSFGGAANLIGCQSRTGYIYSDLGGSLITHDVARFSGLCRVTREGDLINTSS